jgi:hypothetical protein
MPIKNLVPFALPFAVALLPAVAHAKIVCDDGFQVVRGKYLASPYCQDALVAQVAREHGMETTVARIRANPNYRREVCRFVGEDVRIVEYCMNSSGPSGGF